MSDKWRNVIIKGEVFPDSPIRRNVNIKLSNEMLTEYIPTLNKVLEKDTYGMRLLCTIMAHKEGFYRGTRSYRTNNPGNIGNTDSGINRPISTLEDGILAQRNYILKVAQGRHKAYPLGRRKLIQPFYSKEIAKNQKTYGISPFLPGYDFIYTGQIQQFVKIYATGARAGNSYLSMIISFFAKHGIVIEPWTKIQDIILLNPEN